MVLASCKLRRWAKQWSAQKKIKMSLVKGLENLREEKRLKEVEMKKARQTQRVKRRLSAKQGAVEAMSR